MLIENIVSIVTIGKSLCCTGMNPSACRSCRVILLRHGESEFNLQNLFCGWHDTPLSKLGTLRQALWLAELEGGCKLSHLGNIWNVLLIQLLTNSIGIEQSRTIAAAHLIEAKLKIDKVYCSVLRRSIHTAELILEHMKIPEVPIVKDWRLCERHYGNLTGFNKRQTADMYGEDQVQSWRRGYDCQPPPIDPKNKYYDTIVKNPAFKDVPCDKFPSTESMHMCVDRVKPAWEEIKKEMLKGSSPMIIAHGTVARALIMHIEGLTKEMVEKVNVPSCVPILYEFDGNSGDLIGGSKYLGDPKYITEMTKKVASIGN